MNLNNNNLISNSATNATMQSSFQHTETHCSICLEPLGKSVFIVDCGHPFHENCIATATQQKHLCPMCRNKISNRNINILHPKYANRKLYDAINKLKLNTCDKDRDNFLNEVMTLISNDQTLNEQQLSQALRTALLHAQHGINVYNVVDALHEIGIKLPKNELDEAMYTIYTSSSNLTLYKNQDTIITLYKMGGRLTQVQLYEKFWSYIESSNPRSEIGIKLFFGLGGELNQQQLDLALTRVLELASLEKYDIAYILVKKNAKVTQQVATAALLRALESPTDFCQVKVNLCLKMGAKLQPEKLRTLIFSKIDSCVVYSDILLYIKLGANLSNDDKNFLIKKLLTKLQLWGGPNLLQHLIAEGSVFDQAEATQAMYLLTHQNAGVNTNEFFQMFWNRGAILDISQLNNIISLALTQYLSYYTVDFIDILLKHGATVIKNEDLLKAYESGDRLIKRQLDNFSKGLTNTSIIC